MKKCCWPNWAATSRRKEKNLKKKNLIVSVFFLWPLLTIQMALTDCWALVGNISIDKAWEYYNCRFWALWPLQAPVGPNNLALPKNTRRGFFSLGLCRQISQKVFGSNGMTNWCKVHFPKKLHIRPRSDFTPLPVVNGGKLANAPERTRAW